MSYILVIQSLASWPWLQWREMFSAGLCLLSFVFYLGMYQSKLYIKQSIIIAYSTVYLDDQEGIFIWSDFKVLVKAKKIKGQASWKPFRMIKMYLNHNLHSIICIFLSFRFLFLQIFYPPSKSSFSYQRFVHRAGEERPPESKYNLNLKTICLICKGHYSPSSADMCCARAMCAKNSAANLCWWYKNKKCSNAQWGPDLGPQGKLEGLCVGSFND